MKYNIILLTILANFVHFNAFANNDCVHDVSKLKCLEFVKGYSGDTAIFNIPHLHSLFGNKIKVSLIDVKSPSVYSKNKCAKIVAKKAKSFVNNIYKNGKYIELTNIKRDKSFKIKGNIKVDNQDISSALLKKKYAVHTKDFKETNWCKVKI